jgi:hypothetical protein
MMSDDGFSIIITDILALLDIRICPEFIEMGDNLHT